MFLCFGMMSDQQGLLRVFTSTCRSQMMMGMALFMYECGSGHEEPTVVTPTISDSLDMVICYS